MSRVRIVLTFLLGIAAVAALVAAACAGSGVESGETRVRADYGSSWPFTVTRVTLHCENNAVWVEAHAQKYGLNGIAKTRLGAADRGLESIWRVGTGSPRVHIGPMIEEGLALCAERTPSDQPGPAAIEPCPTAEESAWVADIDAKQRAIKANTAQIGSRSIDDPIFDLIYDQGIALTLLEAPTARLEAAAEHAGDVGLSISLIVAGMSVGLTSELNADVDRLERSEQLLAAELSGFCPD